MLSDSARVSMASQLEIVHQYMTERSSGISEKELVDYLVDQKFELLNLTESFEHYFISSDPIIREKSLRILVKFMKLYPSSNDLGVINEFLVTKLSDRYNLQPIAIDGLLYSFIKFQPDLKVILKLIDEQLIVKLNITSMRVEEIFKFYILLERIIITCDLRIFGLNLLNIIHITLKDQFNLDIVISGILLIKILKTRCDSLFLPLELTPDIFDCFKRYFPINSAVSSDNEPMEFTKVFINTISLFKNYHTSIFKMAFDNISSSVIYIRADCFALIHCLLLKINENGSLLTNFDDLYETIARVIAVVFDPFIKIICTTAQNLYESDHPIRISVMRQISLTLYKLDKLIEFEKCIDGYLSQLRFTLTPNSLLALLTFCNIFHVFNSPTIKLLTQNVVEYLKNPIEKDSLDLYCEIFTMLHDFYVLSSNDISMIVSNLIHIDLPNNMFEILTTTYPLSFNSLCLSILFEKGLDDALLNNKNFNERVIKIFRSSPPSQIKLLIEKFIRPYFTKCNFQSSDSNIILLLSIVVSLVKFKFMHNYIWQQFSGIFCSIVSNMRQFKTNDTCIFETLSSIIINLYTHFNKNLFEFQSGIDSIKIKLPSEFLLFDSENKLVLLLLTRCLTLESYFDHHRLVNLIIFETKKLNRTSQGLISFSLDCIFYFTVNSPSITADHIEYIVTQIYDDEEVSIRLVLHLIKAWIIKNSNISIPNISCIFFQEVVLKLPLRGSWKDIFINDLLILQKDKPCYMSFSSWSIFHQLISLQYLNLITKLLNISFNEFVSSKYLIFFNFIDKINLVLLPTNIPLNFPKIFELICTALYNDKTFECRAELFLRNMLINSSQISAESLVSIIDCITFSLFSLRYEKTFNTVFLIQSLRIIRNLSDHDISVIKKQNLINELRFYATSEKRIIRTESMRCLNEFMVATSNLHD